MKNVWNRRSVSALFFKGIAFIPDENGTCINGFQVNDSSFCLTLYYHELKEKPTEQTLVFKASSSLNYTKVEHDRTGTPIRISQSRY